jgi:D-alanyl-D-alanine carboxypeptidase
VTASDRFRIGSITKPIVAALVLISVDRGELGLDDVVGDRIPGVLRPTPAVTVRQLLAHTSGVFDELNEGNIVADAARVADAGLRREATDLLARYAKGERVLAPDRLIVALAETHARYFAPGAGYHYSNTNYQVLAMLLQKATGESLADLLRTRIVTPLGLRSTTVAPADQTSPDLRGYDNTTTGAMTDVTDDLSLYGNGANGGVVTTADELLTILRATVTAKLFPASLVAEMERPVRQAYGLGLGTQTFRCGTFFGHGGSVSGTQSIASISADGARGAVVAINIRSGGDPGLPGVAEDALCRGSALSGLGPQG